MTLLMRTQSPGKFDISQLSTKLFINIAIVIGPTPPGTGVINEQRSIADSNSMSPTIFFLERDSWEDEDMVSSALSPISLMPTSIAMAPSLNQEPLKNPGYPTAEMKISAYFTYSSICGVFEWHKLTVAFLRLSKRASGIPTILERPQTVTLLPSRLSHTDSMRRSTPRGVQL